MTPAAVSGSDVSRASARPSAIEIETSRCCVPSWRLRSIRRRSMSAASTMRARDAFSSSSRARSSAWSRSFSSAKAAAAQTACTSSSSSLHARVDDQRGHGTAVCLDQPHRSRVAVRWQLDGPAARIDVAGFLWEPVGEPEVRVVERARQRFPYLIGAASVLELHDERGHAGPCEALSQEARRGRRTGRSRTLRTRRG